MSETEKATSDQRDLPDASAVNSEPDGTDTPDSELLSEILTSVYRAEGMNAQGFAALRDRLSAIEDRLGISVERTEGVVASEEETVASPAAEADSSTSAEMESSVVQSHSDDPSEVETFPELPPVAQEASTPSDAIAESSLPPMAQPVSSPPSAVSSRAPQAMPQPTQPVRDVRPAPTPSGGELEAIVFGQDLAYYDSLLPQRQGLLAAVRQGDEDAMGLIGQLLIVRSATMDRLPTLLKDVGEAWYRWRGESNADDPLRDALIAWLHTRLESVGLGNRIELVRVGDRYDSKRHNAKARGIEITGVQGWVVLRDNGNVYTKANVTVA